MAKSANAYKNCPYFLFNRTLGNADDIYSSLMRRNQNLDFLSLFFASFFSFSFRSWLASSSPFFSEERYLAIFSGKWKLSPGKSILKDEYPVTVNQ